MEPNVTIAKKRIDAAGTRLRDWWSNPLLPGDLLDSDTQLREAATLVFDYRDRFQDPLNKTTISLRRFVQRESQSPEVLVAQRLKRMPTILDKLARHPNMKLTRMQDIAGCRAILPGGAVEARAVLRRIRKNWMVRELYDYVATPKTTGYRAIHVVVIRDERLIEVQLRTPGQHEWALDVERVGARLRVNLKDGEGPREIVDFFRIGAELIALEESGVEPDRELMLAFDQALRTVRPFFRPGGPAR